MPDSESCYDYNGGEDVIDPALAPLAQPAEDNSQLNPEDQEEYQYVRSMLRSLDKSIDLDNNSDKERYYKRLNKKCNRISLSSILFLIVLCLIIYFAFRPCSIRSGACAAVQSPAYTFDSDPIFKLRQ